MGLRVLDTLLCDVDLWAVTETAPESSEEVAHTQVNEAGKVDDPDICTDIRLDVGCQTPFLPRGETAMNNVRVHRGCSIPAGRAPQEFRCLLNKSSGSVTVAL
jgi:hypothetical protein